MKFENMISPDSIISNSHIAVPTKIYKNAEIMDSSIGYYTSIGNDTNVINSSIGRNCSINRRNYILRSEIDSYSYTGLNTMILSARIGKFCSISWNVSIGGAEHDYSRLTTHPLWRYRLMDEECDKISINYSEQSKCVVGNDVWIATNVVILRDTEIGDGVVIGAGAVVTKNVEPYSIVAGVPAKVIKKRFSDIIISELLKIKWWNWPKNIIRDHQNLIFSETVNIQTIKNLRNLSQSIELENNGGETDWQSK